jgi:hypothetical protein
MCIFYWILDFSITEAFILLRQFNAERKTAAPLYSSVTQFRLRLAAQLLDRGKGLREAALARRAAAAMRAAASHADVDVADSVVESGSELSSSGSSGTDDGARDPSPLLHNKPRPRASKKSLFPPAPLHGNECGDITYVGDERHKCQQCGNGRSQLYCVMCHVYLCFNKERNCHSVFHDKHTVVLKK